MSKIVKNFEKIGTFHYNFPVKMTPEDIGQISEIFRSDLKLEFSFFVYLYCPERDLDSRNFLFMVFEWRNSLG